MRDPWKFIDRLIEGLTDRIAHRLFDNKKLNNNWREQHIKNSNGHRDRFNMLDRKNHYHDNFDDRRTLGKHGRLLVRTIFFIALLLFFFL